MGAGTLVSVVDGAERKRGYQINVSLFGLIGLLRAWRDRTLGQKADRYLGGGGEGGGDGMSGRRWLGSETRYLGSRRCLPRVEYNYRDLAGDVVRTVQCLSKYMRSATKYGEGRRYKDETP